MAKNNKRQQALPTKTLPKAQEPSIKDRQEEILKVLRESTSKKLGETIPKNNPESITVHFQPDRPADDVGMNIVITGKDGEPIFSPDPKIMEENFWNELNKDSQNVSERNKDFKIEGEAIYSMFNGLSVETVFFDLDVRKSPYIEALGGIVIPFLITANTEFLKELRHLPRIDVILCLGILDHFSLDGEMFNTLKDLRTSTAKFLIFSPSTYPKKINKTEEEWKEIFKECGFVYNEILSKEFNSKVKTHREYYQIYSSIKY